MKTTKKPTETTKKTAKKATKKALKPLTPPDLKRCQADKPNSHSFMTLGGTPGLERCKNKPLYVVHEKKPDKDGRRGSMSLCQGCLDQANKQIPGTFSVTTLDMAWLSLQEIVGRTVQSIERGNVDGEPSITLIFTDGMHLTFVLPFEG
jgi:hypothetical protein